jgi:membrane-bound lytic murein transglycosylase D
MKQPVWTILILIWAIALGALVPVPAHGAESPFERPAEIEPLVSFWIDIYTKYDGTTTIIHDEDDPRIRYESMVTEGMTEAQRRTVVGERRVHYSKLLENLALKPREHWSEEEARVAALFGEGTGASRFLRAAGKVHSQRGINDQFRSGLKRSGRWKPTIEGILASYGIPSELAALPFVESAYNPSALSKAGAAGVWQFTRGTGRRFLRIDRYVDERRDVYVATHAAAQYLRDAHSQLGSWALTVTSYNHGVDGMMRAKRSLGTTDIGRLIREYDGPYFGFASKNFYAEFLAAVEVARNAETHFGPVAVEPLEQVERFILPTPARFASLAKAFGTTEEALAGLNPALSPEVIKGRWAAPAGAVINIAAGSIPDPAAAFASLSAADRRGTAEVRDYRVRSGDTLGDIARMHGVSVTALQLANGLGESTHIRAGQVLSIPSQR